MKWRPAQSIRVVALGLQWKADSLLATEVLRDDGTLKGVRPLGGGVEFGETWQSALVREFHEELNEAIKITGPPLVLQNIYNHECTQGHEVMFCAPIRFCNPAILTRDVIHYCEDNGVPQTARWFDLDALEAQGIAVFPEGLRSQIAR